MDPSLPVRAVVRSVFIRRGKGDVFARDSVESATVSEIGLDGSIDWHQDPTTAEERGDLPVPERAVLVQSTECIKELSLKYPVGIARRLRVLGMCVWARWCECVLYGRAPCDARI
jgi:hypothetical protein